MSISMDGVWFVFFACFLVVADGNGFGQQEATRGESARTTYSQIFGKSLIRRLIEANGYEYENYTITTEDGYILNLNRIIHPNRRGSDHGYPLLLVNGYFMQSEAWLVQPKLDSNLALVFSNQGYDVWLGDQRGTIRSRGHVNLTADDKQLWDYSFHETGLYDIPAFTDFILEKTDHKDLIFSCMSLGCSFHAVLAAKRPSYNQKIRAAIYLVPLVNNIRKIADMNSLMHVWFKYQPVLVNMFETTSGGGWFPFMGSLKKELYHICHYMVPLLTMTAKAVWGSSFHIPSKEMCSISVSSLGGENPKSTRHVIQVYDTGDFAEFDYGRKENKKRYGTEWPPLYNMSKITTPVAIYYSDSDLFTSLEGVQKTIKSLGGPAYECKLPNFNHLDVAAGSTFRYVLPEVLDLLDSISGYNNHTEKFKSGKCPSMEWIRHLS